MSEGKGKVYRYVLATTKGILLWLAVFVPSTIIGALATLLSRNAVLGAVLIQVLFLILSMVITRFVLRRGCGFLGFRGVTPTLMVKVFLTTLAIATAIAYVELHLASTHGFKLPVPGIKHNVVLYIFMALILAPICEETLFRGVLLSYMLEKQLDSRVSIITSATLFSLVHLLPFSTALIHQRIFVVSTAFIMSVIAGHLRRKTRSIIPSVITHSSFNLGGFIASYVCAIAEL